MLGLLIALTILSFLVLIAGAAWMLASGGRTTRRAGEEVGREMIVDRMDREDEGTVAQRAAFRGRAVEVRGETSVGLADVKRQLRDGHWRQALPPSLAIIGLLGLLLFGSLALLVAMDNKLVGGLIAFVGLFAVLRVLIALARA